MSESPARTNPIFVIAAIAVILFSVVGVGVMTGVIPSSMSKPEAGTASDNVQPAKPAVASGEKKAPQHTAAAAKPAEKSHAAAPRTVVADAKPAAAPCHECGVIDAINVVEQKGQATGLGAVGGAVVGGLVGNQLGQGRGNTAATIVGAAGGAYAGNVAEKELKKTKRYDVSVRMDDGGAARTVSYDAQPAFRVGDKVKFIDGKLVSN